ncbi:MAG: FadR/GntR family transcriptional regulator [Thermovirgaceae bacterium]
MTLSFKRIDRSTVTENIIEQIKEKILSGEIKPGEKLPPERILAENLSVGRTSVREALRALQYMGVLEVRYGEGTFLSENTSLLTDHFKTSHLLKRFSVMDLVEARKVVEGATVYLAAKRGSPEDREALRDIYYLAEEAVQKGQGEKAFLKADFEFHKKIAEMCQNPVLLEMLDTMRELTLTENLDVIKKPGQIKNALAFHKEILEAVLAYDARRARRKMMEHLKDIENTVTDLIEDRHHDQAKGVEQSL